VISLTAWLRDDRFSIVRYFASGVTLAFVYTVTVVALVDWLHWCGPVWASMISFALWTPGAYLAHRHFTFRHERADGSSPVKFFVSFVVRLAASALVVTVAVDYFGLHYIVGILLNWFVLPLINYFILKLWVFAAP
jgi:putative flippase GtrA